MTLIDEHAKHIFTTRTPWLRAAGFKREEIERLDAFSVYLLGVFLTEDAAVKKARWDLPPIERVIDGLPAEIVGETSITFSELASMEDGLTALSDEARATLRERVLSKLKTTEAIQ